jgi:hypothetical protein
MEIESDWLKHLDVTLSELQTINSELQLKQALDVERRMLDAKDAILGKTTAMADVGVGYCKRECQELLAFSLSDEPWTRSLSRTGNDRSPSKDSSFRDNTLADIFAEVHAFVTKEVEKCVQLVASLIDCQESDERCAVVKQEMVDFANDREAIMRSHVQTEGRAWSIEASEAIVVVRFVYFIVNQVCLVLLGALGFCRKSSPKEVRLWILPVSSRRCRVRFGRGTYPWYVDIRRCPRGSVMTFSFNQDDDVGAIVEELASMMMNTVRWDG